MEYCLITHVTLYCLTNPLTHCTLLVTETLGTLANIEIGKRKKSQISDSHLDYRGDISFEGL